MTQDGLHELKMAYSYSKYDKSLDVVITVNIKPLVAITPPLSGNWYYLLDGSMMDKSTGTFEAKPLTQ